MAKWLVEYRSTRKSQYAGYATSSRRNNPEKYKAIDRVNNRVRKLRIKGALVPESAAVTEAWFQQLCRDFNNACAYCREVRPLTMDHVVPVTRGGKHICSNIVPACQPCNSSKNDSLISEWKETLKCKT